MVYLYHNVPPNMAGTTLFPLNRLKDTHPEIYDAQAAKYRGRESLMERRIPRLECLWNDVLFLTAVHPEHIRRVAVEAGIPYRAELRMYRFDAAQLDPALLVVRLHRRGQRAEYESFDPARVDVYSVFESDSLAYYRESLEGGRRPMLFGHVPHILYKGSLDVSSASIVEG